MLPLEPPTAFVAVDLETTGLDPQSAVPYEIALVSAYADGSTRERCFWLELTGDELAAAEPTALAVGRYHERCGHRGRTAVVPGARRGRFADMLGGLLAGRVLIAANPHFDASFLEVFLTRYASGGRADRAPWHYKVVCIEDRVAGHLGMVPPYTLNDVATKMGVQVPVDRHDALVDARLAAELELALRDTEETRAVA